MGGGKVGRGGERRGEERRGGERRGGGEGRREWGGRPPQCYRRVDATGLSNCSRQQTAASLCNLLSITTERSVLLIVLCQFLQVHVNLVLEEILL